ncbi:hypothetical protein [Listeria phage vB_Lmo_2389_typeII]|uniref:Uncharacterized protein n=1 Tax=Listeria phage LP-030-2 TaxID=1173743 RepID=R4IDV5_9CAUD|nr:hypothetical protein LP030nr2_012 [Listeria phage LP-030-2]AFN39950.1 hypothetical protein LP030nr2_012 [Listeria phage LP-030-2]
MLHPETPPELLEKSEIIEESIGDNSEEYVPEEDISEE